MLLIQATCSEPTGMAMALAQAAIAAKQLRLNIQVNFYANSVIISPTDSPMELQLALDKFKTMYPSINFGEGQ